MVRRKWWDTKPAREVQKLGGEAGGKVDEGWEELEKALKEDK